MEHLTNGDHSSSNHLFYSLKQQQQSEMFLSNSNVNSSAMDMTVLDRQRSRLDALELNWQQRQHRGLDTNSEQIHGSFSNLSHSPEMLTNRAITSDWQQFQSQTDPLMSANAIGAENTNILSDGSALTEMICRSLQSAIPSQQQHRLTNVPNLENGWLDLSSNEDNNNVGMIKVDGNAGSSVPSTAAAFFAPFSSDPGFADRAAKFSSINNSSARVTVATEEPLPRTVGSNDSEVANAIYRTTSRTAQLGDGTGDVQKLSSFTEDSTLSEKKYVGDAKFANENVLKKRKIERSHGANLQDIKGTASEEIKERRSKTVNLGKDKEDSKGKGERSNSDNTVESSPAALKENSKVTDTPKQDYIHVRARRGQATDSHSLAERVRREKISERMKYLQDLVPGCNKITGKAVMLDEIINYVQSLQRQVEFLSMKLATVNPRLDFSLDNFLAKEVMPQCGNFPSIEACPDLTHSSYLQLHQLQQASLKTAACCEMDVPAETPSLHRTGAPLSAELFADTNFQGHGAWDGGLQNAFDIVQGRQSPCASQGLPGHFEANSMKMEM